MIISFEWMHNNLYLRLTHISGKSKTRDTIVFLTSVFVATILISIDECI